jgi:hypothetical protein
LLLQVETAPVLVSSLSTPSATGDSAYRPFSVSGIDCAATAPTPPRQRPRPKTRQKVTAAAAIGMENFEGEIIVIMGLLRLKPIKFC